MPSSKFNNELNSTGHIENNVMTFQKEQILDTEYFVEIFIQFTYTYISYKDLI